MNQHENRIREVIYDSFTEKKGKKRKRKKNEKEKKRYFFIVIFRSKNLLLRVWPFPDSLLVSSGKKKKWIKNNRKDVKDPGCKRCKKKARDPHEFDPGLEKRMNNRFGLRFGPKIFSILVMEKKYKKKTSEAEPNLFADQPNPMYGRTRSKTSKLNEKKKERNKERKEETISPLPKKNIDISKANMIIDSETAYIARKNA